MFKQLLSLVADTESAVPDGLKEKLQPLLTVEPTRYQLSSLGFVQRVWAPIFSAATPDFDSVSIHLRRTQRGV